LADYLIPEELSVLDDELSIIDKYLNVDKIVQPFIYPTDANFWEIASEL